MTNEEIREVQIKNGYDTPEYYEAQCRSMINSILAYGFDRDAEYVLSREENSYHNYLDKYVKTLGRNVVLKLIQEQIDDIDHIEYNVHTDYEGCSYNSIVWVR